MLMGENEREVESEREREKGREIHKTKHKDRGRDVCYFISIMLNEFAFLVALRNLGMEY